MRTASVGAVPAIARRSIYLAEERRLNPSFGDNVRVPSTPLTVQLGLAGLSGSVYGESVPSGFP
jgi:hypothetical protein